MRDAFVVAEHRVRHIARILVRIVGARPPEHRRPGARAKLGCAGRVIRMGMCTDDPVDAAAGDVQDPVEMRRILRPRVDHDRLRRA